MRSTFAPARSHGNVNCVSECKSQDSMCLAQLKPTDSAKFSSSNSIHEPDSFNGHSFYQHQASNSRFIFGNYPEQEYSTYQPNEPVPYHRCSVTAYVRSIGSTIEIMKNELFQLRQQYIDNKIQAGKLESENFRLRSKITDIRAHLDQYPDEMDAYSKEKICNSSAQYKEDLHKARQEVKTYKELAAKSQITINQLSEQIICYIRENKYLDQNIIRGISHETSDTIDHIKAEIANLKSQLSILREKAQIKKDEIDQMQDRFDKLPLHVRQQLSSGVIPSEYHSITFTRAKPSEFDDVIDQHVNTVSSGHIPIFQYSIPDGNGPIVRTLTLSKHSDSKRKRTLNVSESSSGVKTQRSTEVLPRKNLYSDKPQAQITYHPSSGVPYVKSQDCGFHYVPSRKAADPSSNYSPQFSFQDQQKIPPEEPDENTGVRPQTSGVFTFHNQASEYEDFPEERLAGQNVNYDLLHRNEEFDQFKEDVPNPIEEPKTSPKQPKKTTPSPKKKQIAKKGKTSPSKKKQPLKKRSK